MTAERAGKRPQREELALAALLTEPTIAAAARQAGIGESTLLRWLADPDFKARHRAARRAVVEGAVGRLQQAATLAVAALVRNLACGTPAVEVSAAKGILDLTMKAIESDTAERLEAIERLLDIEQRRRAAS